MSKHVLLSAVSIFLLASCNPTTASLTPPNVVTVSPTAAPLPTITAIPTSTAYPDLQTQGPYLIYSIARKNFSILDVDGRGKKQFQLPNEGFVRDLTQAISPDGNWLAYFTGSSSEKPYDLALHLLNLRDQTTIPVARLVAPGFPENLDPVKTSDPIELESCTSRTCRIGLIQYAFNEGIESIDWSPDSASLAFAAQIDGPSSDVYVFNVQDGTVRRVVDDLENVCKIEWSPNGRRILFQNCTAGITYITSYIYIADPEITNIQSPKPVDGGKFWYEHGWLSENSYLISNGGEGAPPQDFRYIVVETQTVKEIWPYTAEHSAIDDKTNTLVLSTIPSGYIDNEPEEGTYVVSIDGRYSKITDDVYVLYAGYRASQVFGWRENQIYSISLDGNIELIGPSEWNEQNEPSVSPDQKWILLLETQHKIALYSTESHEQIRAWELDDYIYNLSWRPDSLGFFVSTASDIFYLPIPAGEPLALDDCSPTLSCGYKDFVWLP